MTDTGGETPLMFRSSRPRFTLSRNDGVSHGYKVSSILLFFLDINSSQARLSEISAWLLHGLVSEIFSGSKLCLAEREWKMCVVIKLRNIV